MNERLKEVRKVLGLTQMEFGDKIRLKGNTIAQYELGRNAPPESAIELICREYNVNEQWLRTGEGEMFVPESRDEQIMAFVGKAMRGEESNFQRRLLGLLARLTVEEWELLHTKMRELMEEE